MPKDASPAPALRYDLLDRAMDERRLALGMRWRDLADHTGMSGQALRDIRRGRSVPRELTVRQLEEALGWSPGSVHRVLAGGGPEVSEGTRGERGGHGDLTWWAEGDAVCYELTREIAGNPFTARLVVRDGRSREQVERELAKVVEMARIQLEG
ncbi:helix-turn-helix protein [Nocardiopsis sp. Huas11]|uniref:helix-turn-helix domain-containing protein n=1 Tax=Nocardiopsis sp. Huas11 TaxID=2183912 RepID=UPI000EB40D42|nr:helix-turn-helix transcriptional regulator [Nocardiopsis sp. Huas11]RKS07582.1 helix-turn-helix protein [Nocardiopsis sp. Huas11]